MRSRPLKAGLPDARGGERLLVRLLDLLAYLLPHLPTDVVLAVADLGGLLAWALDRRGRAVGRQNLEVALGETHSPRARERILRASYRNGARNEVLLFHLWNQPRARLRRWLRLLPEDVEFLRGCAEEGWRGVTAGAHVGNWELLLLCRHVFDFAPRFAYLAESTGSRAIDAIFQRMRDRERGGRSMRKTGALALRSALAQGKIVALLMDRNLRGDQGGLYVPFLGLPARTSPLAARLAQAYRVPLVGVAMLPVDGKRWRITFSPPLMPEPSGDERADVLVGLERANAWLGQAVLRHPETYLWTLKRWKSRPTPEQGRYPDYSFHDPA